MHKTIFRAALALFVAVGVLSLGAYSRACYTAPPCTTDTTGEKVLYWPYFSFPPLFFLEEGHLAGFGAELQEMLINGLPGYDHQRIAASPKRMFRECMDGRMYMVVGALKTREREERMLYSLPCRLALKSLILVRSSDVQKLGNGRSASLRALLADPEIRMGVISGVSYGQDADNMIAEYPDRPNVALFNGPDAMEESTSMLLNDRIDFTFCDPSYLAWFEKKYAVAGQLSLLYVEEMSTPALLGYVTAPKTPEGERMIKGLNAILYRNIRNGELERILLGWAPESFKAEFRRIYKEMIYDPVLN